MSDFAIRPPTPADVPLVLQTWTRTYARVAKRHCGPLAPRAVADAVHATAQLILARPGVEVAVATNPANAWFIFGYAVFERAESVLHWVYVKDLYRGNGIGPELVAYARDLCAGPLRISFRTPASRRLVPDAEYAPELAHPKGNHGYQPRD